MGSEMGKLISRLSTPAALLLAALGWRLQGWQLALALGIAGYAFAAWAHDWEVRAWLRRERDEKAAGL